MLEINPGLILWTIITFIIVLAILRAKAWKPLLQALTEREERIRTALQHAEDAQAEAQRLLEDNKRQLAKAEEESQRIIKQGRELGDRLKAEIVDKANTSSRAMIEQAKDEIQREKEAALTQLRTEVADLAIGVAGKLIDQNLDTAKQRQLADSAIKELQKN
jgi:F-type H+-transporting ATPase subunit b